MTHTAAVLAGNDVRRVRLRVVGCNQPLAAVACGTKFEIELDLKKAFHHGYIDFHGKPPASGTNPLFDEYSNLLAPGPYLVWANTGFGGDDDIRAGESHRLGRALARAYLEQHCGYSWFAHVSNLTRQPVDGWSACRKARGDMPDWIIAGSSTAAVAEAKGTTRAISASRLPQWRKQVLNIHVARHGSQVSLPTYIVANRWVNNTQKRTRPEIYVEDPPTDGREPDREDLSAITDWVMRIHMYRNLNRLGQRELAERIVSLDPQRLESRTPVVLWRCKLPGLEHARFIGRRIPSGEIPCSELFAIFEHIVLGMHELIPAMASALSRWRNTAFFDGMLLHPLKASLHRHVFQPDEQMVNREMPEDVSILSDGSLIAPADFMEIDGIINI